MKVFFLALCPCSSGKSFMILTPEHCLSVLYLSFYATGWLEVNWVSSISMIPDCHTDTYEKILVSEH